MYILEKSFVKNPTESVPITLQYQKHLTHPLVKRLALLFLDTQALTVRIVQF